MSDEYRIIIQPEAQDCIEKIHKWLKEESSESADKWFNGIIKAISSLENFPERCAISQEGKDIGRKVRQLLYGKRNNTYRILFVIRNDEVHILHVRHGRRPHLTTKDDEE